MMKFYGQQHGSMPTPGAGPSTHAPDVDGVD